MSTSTAVLAELAPDTPQSPPAEFAPIARGERIAAIDFVRGMALLGILLVNTANFFAPLGAMGAKYFATLEPVDRVAKLLVSGLCFTKFISIFSMLFGYGLLMQLDRAEQAGQSPGGFAARRLGTLAIFGLIHGLGLWYGDVLLTYAMCGAFVVFFRKVPVRELLILALVFLVYIAAMRVVSEGVNHGVLEMMPSPPAPRGEPRGWDAVVASRGNLTAKVWTDAETVAYAEGPLGDVLLFRFLAWSISLVSMTFGFWCQIVAMFLVGMWMYRVRFFAPEQAGLRRRAMWIGLSVGLLIEGIAALCFLESQRSARVFWAVGASIQAFSPFFLPIGYVALFTWICERLPRLFTLPVTSAGRMALTVYLSETVLATTLAYFYGFGWFGRVYPARQALLALAIWAALAAFSTIWLAVFAQGPMEWLWRRMEYGRRTNV